jgi:hypothetical protein
MRPVYETEADRIRERAIAAKVKNFLAGPMAASTTAVKLKPFSAVDFALCKMDGTVLGFLEVKSRACKSDTYPTYMLSMDKLIALNRLAGEIPVGVFLAVQWEDRLGIAKCPIIPTGGSGAIKMNGRADRGDDLDIEPVVHIPVAAFETVGVISGVSVSA